MSGLGLARPIVEATRGFVRSGSGPGLGLVRPVVEPAKLGVCGGIGCDVGWECEH